MKWPIQIMAKVAKVPMEAVNPVIGTLGSGQEKRPLRPPIERLQHVIFDYNASNNNNNMFVENVKKLSQHIDISGSVRHDTPTVAYSVRTFTDPVFEVPENSKKEYGGG